MTFGSCSSCGAVGLPVKNGQLVSHMSRGKRCHGLTPLDTKEGLGTAFSNNPSLNFFDNMNLMLDLIQERNTDVSTGVV